VVDHLIRKAAQLIPSKPHFIFGRPHLSEIVCDFFTPIGRIYQEMHEFVEWAGPTCRSGEAAAWANEAAVEALGRVTLSIAGRPVVLCHTPSDYNDRTSDGRGPPHSTGCHFNMLSPRQLDGDDALAFAAMVSPLNVVFGPGGLTWSAEGGPRLSCDPRAYHVGCFVSSAAHGERPKPFLLARHEPYARPPFERLQCVAFGAPRSPLSSWLQAELLPWALRAVLARQTPPWCVADPIAALRAAPDEPVSLKRTWRGQTKLISKAELAVETVSWLAEFAENRVVGPEAARRIACVHELSVQAAAALAAGTAQPPVFPTDIAIKRVLLDRAARSHGFADLSDIACTSARSPADPKVRAAVDALIVADILFSSPSRQHSTYELAARNGLFVRPRFEQPVDLRDLTRLPMGISQRDRVRASLLLDSSRRDSVRSCDWDHLYTSDGIVIQLADPWSDLDMAVS
jgi:hypothetical protein